MATLDRRLAPAPRGGQPPCAPAGRPRGRWWHPALSGLALCLGLTLAAPPVAAQGTPAPQCPPQARPLGEAEIQQGLRSAVDHGLLWRASRDGRVVWLYGTLHAAQSAWMFPGPALMAALRESRRLALELDVLDPDTGRRLQAAIRAAPGAPPLPEDLARRIGQWAAAECLEGAWQALRPEMQALTLVALAGRRDGLDPAYGIDNFLAGLARGLALPVIALETPEFQIQALTRDAPDARDDLVRDTLSELDSGQARRHLLRLAQAWARGDLAELSNYGDWCECLDTPQQRAFHDQLIHQRNRRMLPRVLALHQAEPVVMVAVGALHMVGPDGLPALLAAEGFQLQRLGAGAPPP